MLSYEAYTLTAPLCGQCPPCSHPHRLVCNCARGAWLVWRGGDWEPLCLEHLPPPALLQFYFDAGALHWPPHVGIGIPEDWGTVRQVVLPNGAIFAYSN